MLRWDISMLQTTIHRNMGGLGCSAEWVIRRPLNRVVSSRANTADVKEAVLAHEADRQATVITKQDSRVLHQSITTKPDPNLPGNILLHPRDYILGEGLGWGRFRTSL